MALVVLLMFLGVVVSGIAIVRWILGPLEAASQRNRRPAQFSIADFLSLFFLLQFPTAAIHALPDDVPREAKMAFDCVAWVVCGLLWASSVKKLANSGVERPWHRLIFLALVLPVSFFGSLAFISAGVACIACFSNAPRSGIWGPVLLIVELALLVVFRLSADFVRRMVAAAAPKAQARDGEIEDHQPCIPSQQRQLPAAANRPHLALSQGRSSSFLEKMEKDQERRSTDGASFGPKGVETQRPKTA